MQGNLITNLYQYIKKNNPEILMDLEGSGNLTKYLSEKVSTADTLLENLLKEKKSTSHIEELCLDFLTKDLKPSRYHYINSLLEQGFDKKRLQLIQSGSLAVEVCSMVNYCKSVFDDLNFSEENEDNLFLRYAITGVLSEYFQTAINYSQKVSIGI